MLEKGYKTMLEDQHMKIYDQRGRMIIKDDHQDLQD